MKHKVKGKIQSCIKARQHIMDCGDWKKLTATTGGGEKLGGIQKFV